MIAALALVPAILAALAAALCGVAFTLTFAAWMLCDPMARSGAFRPRPWLFLASFAILSATTYTLLP